MKIVYLFALNNINTPSWCPVGVANTLMIMEAKTMSSGSVNEKGS